MLIAFNYYGTNSSKIDFFNSSYNLNAISKNGLTKDQFGIIPLGFKLAYFCGINVKRIGIIFLIESW